MRPSWTRNRSQFQPCLSVTITALPKSSSAGIVCVASRACSAHPRNISCTERLVGLIKLFKKMPNADCDVREKVDIPKRQEDEMHIFLRTSSSALQESSIPSMAHHRSTSRSGFEWWSSRRSMHVAELAFLFSKVADAAREHQTHDQPTEKWNVVCGPGRFSELGCVDLGVVRTRAGVTRADVSANGTQAGRGSVFSSRTLACLQLSAESDFEGPRSDPRSRAISKK